MLEPSVRWPRPHLKELAAHRDLVYFLSWRDIKVRYKQSLIGFGWAVIQPLASMVVFTLIFSKVGNVPSEGFPYPVFVLAGIIPWNYFSNAVTASSTSLVSNMPLITKVYFPRLVLPMSATLTWLLDFGVATVLLFVVMAFYGIAPSITILLLPAVIALLVLTALGVGLWLSSILVKYRDVQQALAFVISMWFFLTPVIYPGTSVVHGPLSVVYSLNPMVGVVELFRWVTIGGAAPSLAHLLPSILVVMTLVGAGWLYFLKAEQEFADVI